MREFVCSNYWQIKTSASDDVFLSVAQCKILPEQLRDANERCWLANIRLHPYQNCRATRMTTEPDNRACGNLFWLKYLRHSLKEVLPVNFNKRFLGMQEKIDRWHKFSKRYHWLKTCNVLTCRALRSFKNNSTTASPYLQYISFNRVFRSIYELYVQVVPF